ncbi:MAG: SDR family NAD(P)-dependent oxidoreductase [Candidatus Nanoarchaeia archaeon]|nr:SDR family NAD(P)-dependent oxidoreductase [Candidatus Nanoarchaeia archaeon]
MKEFLRNKVILITGGTGFLGQSLIEEILKHNPKSIRVFSRDEFKHHNLHEKFGFNYTGGPIRHLIGDVRDYERLKRAMQGCDIVIHAAALKRIDMIEYNVEECIKTNVLGTLNVVRAALENNVGRVVFVSTDKACSPVNTYGACKFVGERIFIESNFSKGDSRTVLTCVRYGNVINSTGSMIPSFIKKIKNGEEISLTDERMTRFLISPKQAVNLIFKAIEFGVGGEIFVPKLPSFKISDLIEALKEVYKKDNPVKVVGIRPGEKIHEFMINETEASRTYEFDDSFVITSQIEGYQHTIKYSSYLKRAKKVNFETYNSKEGVLDKEHLRDYLKKMINPLENQGYYQTK